MATNTHTGEIDPLGITTVPPMVKSARETANP